MKHCCRLFLFLLFLPGYLSAAREPLLLQPNFIFENINTNNGLPSSEVYRVMQDAEGYIWFATDRGLARYDGQAFKIFTEKDGLPGLSVLGLFSASDRLFWFSTYGGGIGYRYKGRLYSFPWGVQRNYLQQQPGHPEHIYFISERVGFIKRAAQPQLLWFVIDYERHMALLREQSIPMAPSTSPWPVIKLFKAPGQAGVFFLQDYLMPGMARQEAYSIKKKNSSQALLYLPSKLAGHTSYNYRLEDGAYLLVCGNVLMKVNATLDKVDWIDSLPGAETFRGRLKVYHHKAYIPTSAHGLMIYDLKKRCLLQQGLLEGLTVTDVLSDRENNLWISTLEKGVYLSRAAAGMQLLSAERFERVKVQGDRLLLSGPSPFYYFKAYSPHTGKLDFISEIRYRNTFTLTDEGTLIYQDKEKQLWKEVGNSRKQLLYPSIFQGKDMGAGRNCVVLSNGSSYRIYWPDTTIAIYSPSQITCLRCYESNCWLGTLSGVEFVDLKTGRSLYRLLEGKRISDILLNEQVLWVATLGDGIYAFDIASKKQLYHITESNGLQSNICGRMFIDQEHYLWVCSNMGLSAVELKSGPYFKVHRLTHYDGLPSNEVLDVARIRDYLYFITSEGLVRMHMDFIRTDPPLTLPKISGLVSGDRSYSGRELNTALHFAWNERNVELSYTDNYINRVPGQRCYRYKLLGAKDSAQWTYTSLPRVQFANLAPGSYTFLLSSANKAGWWNPNPVSVHFSVSPHFTRSAWFMSLIVLGTSLLVFSVIRFRFKLVKEGEALKRRVLESELALLRTQMNPHFMYNSLNAIQNYIFKNDNDNAMHYLGKFSSLMRNILHYSQKEYIYLREEIAFLSTYLQLEKIRFAEKFDYRIEVDEGLDQDRVTILPLLLQPVVENAVKHAFSHMEEKGELLISFYMEDEMLYVLIDDNGIGIAHVQGRSAFHQSVGLEVIKKRIDLLNGIQDEQLATVDLYDKSELPGQRGTRVIFKLPLNV